MDYQQFAKEFMDKLQLNMAHENVEISRHEVTKTNGVVKDGITIKYPDTVAAPTEYLDDLYVMHKNGRTVDELVKAVASRMSTYKEMAPEIPPLNEESARKNLYCVVLNAADNAEMLKHTPHEKLEDLAIVPRFRVGSDGSFLVTDEICKTLQMTSEEVMEAAHANTDRQEFTCQSMGEVMREILMNDGMPEEYADEMLQMQDEQCPMWILSTVSKVDGAVALTSQEALRKARERLGESYFILPSSRHEIILVPESFVADSEGRSSVENLKCMVMDINKSEAVSKIDKLSDEVYHFDGRHLSIANSETMEKGKSQMEEMSKGHARSH